MQNDVENGAAIILNQRDVILQQMRKYEHIHFRFRKRAIQLWSSS